MVVRAVWRRKKEKPHYNPRTVLKGVKSPLTRLNLKVPLRAHLLAAGHASRLLGTCQLRPWQECSVMARPKGRA